MWTVVSLASHLHVATNIKRDSEEDLSLLGTHTGQHVVLTSVKVSKVLHRNLMNFLFLFKLGIEGFHILCCRHMLQRPLVQQIC